MILMLIRIVARFLTFCNKGTVARMMATPRSSNQEVAFGTL
jgi:hypothetical protein